MNTGRKRRTVRGITSAACAPFLRSRGDAIAKPSISSKNWDREAEKAGSRIETTDWKSSDIPTEDVDQPHGRLLPAIYLSTVPGTCGVRRHG